MLLRRDILAPGLANATRRQEALMVVLGCTTGPLPTWMTSNRKRAGINFPARVSMGLRRPGL